MEKIKYTLYDLLGYFIPGSIVLWFHIELINYLTKSNKLSLMIKDIDLSIRIIFITIISYTIGHLLHSIANLTIDKLPSGKYPPKNYFPDKFKEDIHGIAAEALVKKIKTEFNNTDETIKEDEKLQMVKDAYWLCYSHVINTGKETLSQTYLSMSGFYRGFTIGFYLIAVSSLISFFITFSFIFLWVFSGALIIGQLFFFRNVRFKNYLTKSVYSEFLTINKKSLEGDKK
jgi:hypothetical protein